MMLSIFSHGCWPLLIIFGESSFHILCPFCNWIVCLFVLSCKSFLYLLDPKHLPNKLFVSPISYPIGFLFSFLDNVLWFTVVFNLMRSSLSKFSFVAHAFVVILESPLLSKFIKIGHLWFLLRVFLALFRLLVHFSYFLYMVWVRHPTLLFYMSCAVPAPFVEDKIHSLLNGLRTFVVINWP